MTNKHILEGFIGLLVENLLESPNNKPVLWESKQNIVNLGIPSVVASLFLEVFGNKAFLLARWFKETHDYQNKPNWFGYITSLWGSMSLSDMVEMYDAAASGNAQAYQAAMANQGLSSPNNEQPDEYDLKEKANTWKSELRDKLLKDHFFASVLVADIVSGKVTDLKPFTRLTFQQAQDKHDKKRVFSDAIPVKQYPNGWKWINVGAKCKLVGAQMKNCGSTGVMSMDEDKSMITLFDSKNKPHVVVTYSPNEGRISGDEGVGSTPVKEIYQDYVFDLAKTLGVKYDFIRSNSFMMKVKGAVGPENFISMSYPTGSSTYAQVKLRDGSTWFTNGYNFVSQPDIEKMLVSYENSLHKTLAGVFHTDLHFLRQNKEVNYIPAVDFQQTI